MSRKIPILLYHRVGERDGSFMDQYTVTPESFRMQMEWIHRHDWTPTTLENVLREKIEGVPDHALVITFDDGFASNRVYAWPILDNYHFPSATFLVANRLGSRNLWDGPGKDIYSLISHEDLSEANPKLMQFHSHSLTHPRLPLLGRDALRKEIEESRDSILSYGASGSFFAYPYGEWNRQVMERVREAGYSGACTCIEGLNSEGTDPFLLRRVEIKDVDLGWRFWLKLKTGHDLFRHSDRVNKLSEWLRRRTLVVSGN